MFCINKVKEISCFIERMFRLYNISKSYVQYNYHVSKDEEMPEEIFPDGKIDQTILEIVSEHLGISVQQILDQDEKAATAYYEKYPFFRLYKQYMFLSNWYHTNKNEPPKSDEFLLNILFPNLGIVQPIARYDDESIHLRLIEKLREIDEVMPGTFHEEEEIEDLHYYSDVMFSFPHAPTMLKSFIDMVEHLETLFFKALSEDLSESEAAEMNFLAHQLWATDSSSSDVILTYKNVCTFRPVYIEENLKDFYSYVKFRSFIRSEPWKCYEFFDNMDDVQKFVNIFPSAKSRMREFHMHASKILCSFLWSDAKPIRYEPWEIQELEDLDYMHGLTPKKPDEYPKERTEIYIDKTKDEMLGWDKALSILGNAVSPPSQGGLIPYYRELDSNDIQIMMARIDKRVEYKNQLKQEEI